MKEDNGVERFVVLEDKLNKILKGYAALQEEKEGLFSQMKEQKEEMERLREEISTLRDERVEVHARIERLIKRLEGLPID
jgi:septal ring factor EnvC (AmiA/AmiB activator)